MTSINHYLEPHKERYKDRFLILESIRKRIVEGSGLSISELREEHSEDSLFYEALKYVTTTKKALCTALSIPVEGACRYKRHLEDAGKLWEVEQVYCPFTRHLAWTLTTNPDERPLEAEGPKSVQLSLFS